MSGAAGYLGRPATGATVAIPDKAKVGDGMLSWSQAGRFRPVKNPADVLQKFVSLAVKADDEDILAFAQEFGPLWLCAKHGIIVNHRPILGPVRNAFGPLPTANELKGPLACPTAVRERMNCEPLDAWRRLATRAQNLMLAARLINLGEEMPSEAWISIDGDKTDFSRYEAWAHLADPRQRLAENLNWWMLAADINLTVRAEPKGLRTALTPAWIPSVLGIVAIQLVLTCCHSEGLFTCAGCGAPFIARRMATRGSRVYCETCRTAGVSLRDAKRDSRARKRLKRGKVGT
jgi:hypothetical protein